jgi:cyclopropane fatty-acyl-phospholipid synthase-like methyltransferase
MKKEIYSYQKSMDENARSLKGNVNGYLRWNIGVFPIKNNKRILDIGCGPGFYFDEIMKFEPSLYCAADYSDDFLKETESLFKDRSNCKIAKIDVMDKDVSSGFTGQRFDYVLCLEVLEHIANDKEALFNIHKIMSNTGGGALFLRVPALQSIYGENDKAIGHYRRYSIKSLRKVLEECSFEVKIMRYQNIIGILPWYIIGSVFKRRLAVSCFEGKIFNSLVPVVRFLEGLIGPPVGLSIYCVCTTKK